MYYPVFLNLKGRDCVVVGGGAVALRKALSLIACGARVSVYAPDLVPELEKLALENKIIAEKKPYEPDDLVGASLVICATDDDEINAWVAREAKERGLLINVVDEPELCNFFVPSVLRRGKLAIAVSTEGASPAMAKMIRERLEEMFGPEYEIFLEAMDRLRSRVKEVFPDEEKRKEFFTQLVHSELMKKIKGKQDLATLEKMLVTYMEEFKNL